LFLVCNNEEDIIIGDILERLGLDPINCFWYNCLLYCSRVGSRHGVFAFQLTRFTRRDFRSFNP